MKVVLNERVIVESWRVFVSYWRIFTLVQRVNFIKPKTDEYFPFSACIILNLTRKSMLWTSIYQADEYF